MGVLRARPSEKDRQGQDSQWPLLPGDLPGPIQALGALGRLIGPFKRGVGPSHLLLAPWGPSPTLPPRTPLWPPWGPTLPPSPPRRPPPMEMVPPTPPPHGPGTCFPLHIPVSHSLGAPRDRVSLCGWVLIP